MPKRLFLTAALLATVAGSLAAALTVQGVDARRGAVLPALYAVEGDSVASMRERLAERAARDADDRLARLGLATLDRLTYDYDAAERGYASLVDRADAVAAYAQLGRGDAAYSRGNLVLADSLLSLARTVSGGLDPAGEAQALGLIAMSRAPVQGLDVGLVLLDSAARVVPDDAPDVRAELLRARMVLLTVQAEFAAATALLDDCLRTARAARLARAEAQCHRSDALAQRLQGQDDSAVALLDIVERLQRQGRDHSALAETLVRRSDALRSAGRFGELLPVLHEADSLGRASRNDFALGSVHTALASVALRLRDYPTAQRALDDADRLFSASGDEGSLAIVLGFRSILAEAQGDLEAARRHAVAAAEHYAGMGDVTEELASWRQLAAVEMRAGDFDAAERAIERADALTRRTRQPELTATLDYDRGRLALLRGELAGAERLFRGYLAQRDTAERVLRHTTRSYLAEILARRGELERAERELVAANRELELWRASLPDNGQRELAFQATGHDLTGRDPSAAVVIAALAAGGRAGPALALAEQRRARALMDRMVQGEAMRSGPMVRSLAVADSGGADGASGFATGGAPVAALNAARGAPLATVERIVQALPDDRTAFLEYVAGVDGAPTTLFVVTRGGVRAHLLPSTDSVVAGIARYVTLLESGDAPRALGRALGAALLDSAVAGLEPRIERLVIVPDGVLHRVPFDALLLADDRYAVERYAIGLAPSAAVATALWERPRRVGGPTRLLALGDPAFAGEGASGDGRAFRTAFDSAGGLARLAASGREARLVARYAGEAEVRVRGEASAAYLRGADLEPFRVIHLATHALVDDRVIGRSALALAPGEGESGFLGAGDLAALELAADLVVLSACRTAGGVVLDGEGVQGLTAPLLQAGARAVVATGWKIADEPTVDLVVDFYAALARGEPVGDALRAAKLAAIARGAPPSEWAAFTVVGDASVTVPLHAPTSRGPLLTWLAVALAAVGALGAVAYHVGRRDPAPPRAG